MPAEREPLFSEQPASRLPPRRADLLRRHLLRHNQILNLSPGDMAAHGMTVMDPAREPGTAVDFGLSRPLAINLYLGKPLLPAAHLEPIIRETDLTAREALAFFGIGFDRLKQVIGLHPRFHGGCDQAQTATPVSDPVLRIGHQDLLRFKIFDLFRLLAPARRWFKDGFRMVWGPP